MTYPTEDKWLQILAKENVESFYTSPTALRNLRQSCAAPGRKFDLSSLKFIGSVGEPINPEIQEWFQHNFGQSHVTKFVDTWWQTETGGHMIVNGVPIEGVKLFLHKNELFIKGDWPGRMLSCWGNDKRYTKYFVRISDVHHNLLFSSGDLAMLTQDSNVVIFGRADDVINVSGHRLGSVEIENLVVSHPLVAEAAAVSVPDELTGEAILVFVRPIDRLTLNIEADIRYIIARGIGKFALPREIIVVADLPKTRSGKIMRRVLRAQYLGQAAGDLSTMSTD
jgi:acetyl-CoA synthetase